MRASQVAYLLLTTAGCLAGRLGWAQRTAVAPLAPLPPVVRPVAPALGVSAPIQWNEKQPPTAAPPAAAYAAQPARPVILPPVYLLNARILIGNGLGAIKPQDIAKIDVYKGEQAPAQWRGMTANGIISITLKPGVKLKIHPKSLAAIRRQLRLKGEVSFQLEGHPIEDTSLRVDADAIARLDVQRRDSATVVNIRLVPPKPTPPRNDPPGTIYIRGMASR